MEVGAESHFVGLVRAMAETNHQSTALVHPDGLIARQLQQTAIRLFTATFRNVMDLRGYLSDCACAASCSSRCVGG